MSFLKNDIKQIVDLVGRDGAIFALEKSKKINTKALIDLARSIGLSPKAKDSKRNVSIQIVQNVDKRIDKSLDELKGMSKDDLILYFEKVECHQDELIELLKNIDLKARVKTNKAIIEFAAIQISSLGIFERLSNHEVKKLSDQASFIENGKDNQQINSDKKS
ncbi:MAG: hypothetical protein KAV87_40010 [Desulfobacteraceae bacterium]|nr:hypothetical protein [Desulfobacteraceae bacterium]